MCFFFKEFIRVVNGVLGHFVENLKVYYAKLEKTNP